MTLINVGQSLKHDQRALIWNVRNAYILGPSSRVRLLRTTPVVGPIYQFRARRPVWSRWTRAISALSAANFTAPPSIHHAPLTLARSLVHVEEGKCRTDIPFVSSSPKLTAPSLAPFSDKFPDRLAANRSTRQRDLITNCFALLSPPSGRHRCERVEAITPREDLIAHCVVVVVTGHHSTSFRESGMAAILCLGLIIIGL